MSSRSLRSSSSTRVVWGGVLIALFGLATGAYALVPLLQGELLLGLGAGLAGTVILLAGAAVVALGARSRVRVDAEGLQWPRSAVGGTVRVPWREVARVHVPGIGDPAGTVVLLMRDGRTLPVTPLRRLQAADESTALSPWYLRSGEALIRAHQQWLAAHRP